MIKRNLYFRESVLIYSLRITIANATVLIDKGCNKKEEIQNYIAFYTCISLRAYNYFIDLNKQYTSKNMALKKYQMLYFQALKDAQEDEDIAFEILNIDNYRTKSDDEILILYALCQLFSFVDSDNTIRIRHVLNTYIPKLNSCLRNANKYVKYIQPDIHQPAGARGFLFKFLVENG